MVQARISGMISTDICQDCNNADIRLDSFILGNIADSGMITFGCVYSTCIGSCSHSPFLFSIFLSSFFIYKSDKIDTSV